MKAIEKFKAMQKSNEKVRKVVELFIPLSFILFVAMYLGAIKSTVIINYAEMMGYMSYDLSGMRTMMSIMENATFWDYMSYLPATTVMLFVPIFSFLGIVITMYITSLCLRKDVKQKAVLFFLSTAIMCAVNFFLIIFVVGLGEVLTQIVFAVTIIDLLIIANRVRVAFFVKKEQDA